MPTGALSAALPASSGSDGRYERVLRLSRLHYQPRLAAELDRALGATGAGPSRSGRLGRVPGADHDLVRSFVGALTRLPDGRVGELVALLEGFTFPRVLTALGAAWPKTGRQLPSRFGRHLPSLFPEWEARSRPPIPQDGLQLRIRLVQAMRRRLVATGATPAAVSGLEALVHELLRRLAAEYRIPSDTLDERLLQQVLLAAGRSVPSLPAPSGLSLVGARLLARLTVQSAAVGALMGLAYAGRQRISLTVTTLLYVLMTGLFGVNLPFGAYEWMARAMAVLLEPPVLAASAVALGARTLARYQRRFDMAVLGHALWAIYQAV